MLVQNSKFGAKPLIWGELGAKLEFWASVISSVGNLQLSVGKLQLPPTHTFSTHDAAGRIGVRTITRNDRQSRNTTSRCTDRQTPITPAKQPQVSTQHHRHRAWCWWCILRHFLPFSHSPTFPAASGSYSSRRRSCYFRWSVCTCVSLRIFPWRASAARDDMNSRMRTAARRTGWVQTMQ